MVYKFPKVKHHKSRSKKLIVYESNLSEKQTKGGKINGTDLLKVNSRISDPDRAPIKADSGLVSHNEHQQYGSLTMMGTPQLMAGN